MLRDILVIDLTRHLPGPYATWLLAHHGANVLKVEAPTGDPTRVFPPYGEDGVSAVFAQLNRGKRSLGLNLKHPEGVETLNALLDKADVLVEGFRPGVVQRLGIDLERNPRLVRCSLSGYGQTGPYRDTPGHDLNYQAYAGALSQAVGEDGQPALPGLQLGDLSAALGAVIGILMALHERARTGRGRAVDASMLEALVSFQSMGLAAHLAGQPWNPGEALLSGAVPCYRVYATADGRSGALGALEPKFWLRFCAAIERDDWTGRQFDGTLIAEVAEVFRSQPLAHWREKLEASGCCFSPVLSYDELAEDPQIKARALLPPGPPFRLMPPLETTPDTCAAHVGQDSRALLGEHLGLDAAAIDALVSSGAVLD